MAVTDDQVATLRAQLVGNTEEHVRLLGRLDPVAAQAGLRALISAAFFTAAERRFGTGNSTAADVIEFVGSLRSRFDSAASDIDPRIAERLLLAAVSDEQISDLDPKTSFTTQHLLLAALVADAQLDMAALDEFLGQSRKLADQWLA